MGLAAGWFERVAERTDVRDAGQLVRQRVLTQRTGLVEGAPRAVVDALRHIDDARATQLLAVAVGPARDGLVDVDFLFYLVRVRARLRLKIRRGGRCCFCSPARLSGWRRTAQRGRGPLCLAPPR